MELPEDVLGLVRAFSKPRMRFYKEYRQSLTELGFAHDEHWLVLRDKLCSLDADCVFATFLAYKDTTLFLRHLKNIPVQIPNGPQLYSIIYHEELQRQQLKWNKLDRELRVLLVGEQLVADHERWTRYELE